ncbi:hypothetical protein FA95DRAFT_562879 [Auriscalpium vulgare]|uniref:Uncharacterized protein n=1 Tax=Auriscalpium vulgare TaxID=40419 RepID=A0ACB8RFY0_9AGAM|nr:hypothetical protein FA95DRAFT_562879 [Auriscalpium vulgare]
MFLFRRRACKNCIQENMYIRNRLPFRFTKFESKLLDCLPIFEGKLKPWGEWRYWWGEDVEALRRDLDGLLALHGGEDGDAYHQDLSELTEVMGALLEAKRKHADLCESWEGARAEDRYLEMSEQKRERFHDIKDRLMVIGYDEADIDKLWGHKEVAVAKCMTDRIWKRVFPLLQHELDFIIELRLAQEAEERRQERLAFVSPTYAELLRHLPTRLAPFLDCLATVEKHAVIAATVEPDERPAEEFCDRLFDIMTGIADTTLDEVTDYGKRLIALIPETRRSLVTTEVSAHAMCTDEFYTGTAGGLGLATTHFYCSLPTCTLDTPGCGLTAGLDALAARRHFRINEHTPAYCNAAAEATLGLLASLGMGPASSAHELDRVDARFQCGICPRLVQMGSDSMASETLGMCWRAAIEHALTEHKRSETLPWIVLQWDRSHAREDVGWVSAERLGCTHCHHHLEVDGWCEHPEILRHLSEACVVSAIHSWDSFDSLADTVLTRRCKAWIIFTTAGRHFILRSLAG